MAARLCGPACNRCLGSLCAAIVGQCWQGVWSGQHPPYACVCCLPVPVKGTASVFSQAQANQCVPSLYRCTCWICGLRAGSRQPQSPSPGLPPAHLGWRITTSAPLLHGQRAESRFALNIAVHFACEVALCACACIHLPQSALARVGLLFLGTALCLRTAFLGDTFAFLTCSRFCTLHVLAMPFCCTTTACWHFASFCQVPCRLVLYLAWFREPPSMLALLFWAGFVLAVVCVFARTS